MTVRNCPRERWALEPMRSISATTRSIAPSGAPWFITMIKAGLRKEPPPAGAADYSRAVHTLRQETRRPSGGKPGILGQNGHWDKDLRGVVDGVRRRKWGDGRLLRVVAGAGIPDGGIRSRAWEWVAAMKRQIISVLNRLHLTRPVEWAT